MVTGRGTAEAVTSLSKAEETEVWAQDRVSVSRAAVTKRRKLGELKQCKCLVCQFWRRVVWSQGGGRATFSPQAPRRSSPAPSSVCGLPALLLGRCITPASACISARHSACASPHLLPAACVHLWAQTAPLLRTPVLLHQDWITSAKTLFPNKVTF